jgi:dihydrodipicolinate synthase/N-acetylneuraminate lyase
MPAGTTPMVGLISLSLPTIRERLERCLARGLTHFQISLPCWSVLSDREVDRFFAETCGRYPEARFLHYNLMRTKRLLTGADYARLAAAHPNLVAVKTGGPTPEFVADLLTKAPDLQFFVGEPNYTRFRDRYECGLLISLAGIHPAMAQRYHAARGAELAALGADLATVRDALMEAAGKVERMDGYYDKLLLKATVPELPLRLLPPYESPDDTVFAQFMRGLPAAWRLARP